MLPRHPAIAISFAIAVLAAASAMAPGPAPVLSLRDTGRPNIILIVTDDMRADSLEAMPYVQTLLGGHGVTFSNAFVTTAFCCPSRASILTGQYSRNHGVLSGVAPDGGAAAFDDTSTLATWLQDGGYTTAMVGKYLNDYPAIGRTYVPPGWDEFDAIASDPAARYYNYLLNENGHLTHHGIAPSDYSTTVLTRLASSFVERTYSPFFLYFAPIAPHEPAVPAPGPPEELRPQVEISESASFDEADVTDKPWGDQVEPLSAARAAQYRGLQTSMPESLSAVDEAIRRLVATVGARGGLDNTIIIFTSDNGFLWGEHRLRGKIWPYEESIRVPLVVRMPDEAGAQTDDHLALNIDLASTIAELAGVGTGLPQDGVSLVPLLRGQASSTWRDSFVVEYLGSQKYAGTPPPFEAIRTERYLYVRYLNGWRELYDLRSDPFELDNIAGSSPDLQAGLDERLDGLLAD